MSQLLTLKNLNIAAQDGQPLLVSDVSFSLQPGEVMGIVGESGSGKTLVSKAILRLLPAGIEVTAGQIMLQGKDIAQLPLAAMQKLRGNSVGMIFQEPMTSLNPSMLIGRQMEEGLRLHRNYSAQERRRRIIDMLQRVGIPAPEQAVASYPHQFSGGMRQRIMIASVMLLEPALLIADEPTTALDAIIQKDVLQLLLGLCKEKNTAILLISHDLPMIARYTQKVVVMAQGKVVETGETQTVMTRPQQAYTQKLLSAVPKRAPTRLIADRAPVIRVENLAVDYHVNTGTFSGKKSSKRVLEGINLAVLPGEIVAVVGESGSGKSTIGKVLVGLQPMTEGQVYFDGQPVVKGQASYGEYRRQCQMVFQDPNSSLDPRMRISEIITEPLRHVRGLTPAQRQALLLETLNNVGLAAYLASRYPHQLSGGQRQRVAIARAVISRPRFIVADEPVSALDVTVRAEILKLFKQLQQTYDFACLFISHDLAVVEELADRVIVMRRGGIVESGTRDSVFDHPQDNYTRSLLAASQH